eukprot:120821-Pelagomonas_calceolata.AAC.1
MPANCWQKHEGGCSLCVKEGHDAIFVVVDRLTKMTHIIPTTTTISAQGVAQLYRDHVFVHHGYSKAIVEKKRKEKLRRQ